MIKILFLASNPLDTVRLRIDEEYRAIDSALRQGEYREQLVLISHWAVRTDDLQELLLRHQPNIVHFSGHGSEQSGIYLQYEQGNSNLVPPDVLSELFGLLKNNIRCVVLSACYSKKQAIEIAQHIDSVVGMSDAISDEAAREFAIGFYRGLSYGASIQTAFELGRMQIASQNVKEQDALELITNQVDPSQIYFIHEHENLDWTEPYLRHFTGRQWLVSQIDTFLEQLDRGYFIIEADAGMGKTTFLAWLVKQRNYISHFCGRSKGTATAVSDLIAQIVKKYDLRSYDSEFANSKSVFEKSGLVQ
ncbi:MAG: CHAT domain-containing protein [Caldilineaceae bacterium]